MKTINQSAKPKMSNIKKTVIYTILIIIAVYAYISMKTTPKPKKSTNGFSALYSGNSKPDGSEQPAKLKWADSFKGINNSGNK